MTPSLAGTCCSQQCHGDVAKRAFESRLVQYFWEREWMLWAYTDASSTRWVLSPSDNSSEFQEFHSTLDLWRWWARRVTWSYLAEACAHHGFQLYLGTDAAVSQDIYNLAMVNLSFTEHIDITEALAPIFLYLDGRYPVQWKNHARRLAWACAFQHEHVHTIMLRSLIVTHNKNCLIDSTPSVSLLSQLPRL